MRVLVLAGFLGERRFIVAKRQFLQMLRSVESALVLNSNSPCPIFQLRNISMSVPKLARICLAAAVGSFSVYSLQIGSSEAISGESVGSVNSLAIQEDFLVLNQTDCPPAGSVSGNSSGEISEDLMDWEFTEGPFPRPPRCRGFRR